MPFYQFNSFTGRLKESSQLQPLYPLSTNPLNKADPPKMIWDSIKTRPLKTATPSLAASTATKSSSSSTKYSPLDPKLLAKMKKFQANLDIPVFMAGGAPDKILFGITCVLVAVGLTQSFKLAYDMAYGKSK